MDLCQGQRIPTCESFNGPSVEGCACILKTGLLHEVGAACNVLLAVIQHQEPCRLWGRADAIVRLGRCQQNWTVAKRQLPRMRSAPTCRVFFIWDVDGLVYVHSQQLGLGIGPGMLLRDEGHFSLRLCSVRIPGMNGRQEAIHVASLIPLRLRNGFIKRPWLLIDTA